MAIPTVPMSMRFGQYSKWYGLRNVTSFPHFSHVILAQHSTIASVQTSRILISEAWSLPVGKWRPCSLAGVTGNPIRAYTDPGGSDPLAKSIRRVIFTSGSDPPPDQCGYDRSP